MVAQRERPPGVRDSCNDGGDPDGGGGGKTDSEPPKDPNEIVGPAGITDMKLIQKDERLVYTIYFENVPTAAVPAQEVFIENFLDEIPDDDLVVFLMHIPWVNSTKWADESERDELFGLLASQPNTISLAAHTHRYYHEFIDNEFGWPGDKPHHMVSMGAVCGSWWNGAPDEYGIPHTMMQDGTPTGYSFLEIDGTDWKLHFKAARRPVDFQMHISAPSEISIADIEGTKVFANVFNALPGARVEMRIHQGPKTIVTEWQQMFEAEQPDPVYEAMKAREDSLSEVPWIRVGDANPNPRHLWQASLPANLDPGAYTISVRSRDEWHQYEGKRIVRITE